MKGMENKKINIDIPVTDIINLIQINYLSNVNDLETDFGEDIQNTGLLMILLCYKLW